MGISGDSPRPELTESTLGFVIYIAVQARVEREGGKQDSKHISNGFKKAWHDLHHVPQNA
jgi:hypothetical protein